MVGSPIAKIAKPRIKALLFLDQLNSSCTKPIQGVPIAKEEVIPAKNNKPNQATPAITERTLPH